MEHEQSSTTMILCDNKSAISITMNPTMHGRTKHMEIRYHFIRSHIAERELKLEHCSTDDQLVDIMTKPLAIKKHLYFRSILGVCGFQSQGSVEG